MENLRSILASPILRELREQLGDQPAPTLSAEELLVRPMPEMQEPEWSLGSCTVCHGFLRRNAYLKCRVCEGLVCKTGECKGLHGALHSHQQRHAATTGEINA